MLAADLARVIHGQDKRMIDRARGRVCVTASYDSTEAMVHAANTAMGLRADLVQETGMHIVEVAEFELAVAHLAVPELV